jgi:hypothetical protein
VSRAGWRARRERLIAAGLWEPSAILAASEREPEGNRARAFIAERDDWLREVGSDGWQREQNRRRASRTAATRQRLQVRDPESAP